MGETIHVEIARLERTRSGTVKTLDIKIMNLNVKRGEWFSIVGPSHSGKTLLLNLIGGFLRPSSGYIRIDGQDFTQMNEDQSASFRRKALGYIPQEYKLLCHLSVAENIFLPLMFDGYSKEDCTGKVVQLLRELGLEGKANNLPSELSEGEKQMVVIARALVNSPPLLLADEPTSNLDLETGANVIRLFQKLKNQHVTLICVSHDIRVIRLSNKIARIENGQITKIDEQREILANLQRS
ncbi:MAG TPA: ABC transporter ATP-binding protein [Candidatus Bathyarchaeia archaeon]|nr:MAG: hypothetical protein A3K70_02440 [Candidatus Bathyarchaeota archaeon RBG_16_48_13]HJX23766.1 ABC transporter ATP-binding protein [Candidatus Bathyarchaeia archaeon]